MAGDYGLVISVMASPDGRAVLDVAASGRLALRTMQSYARRQCDRSLNLLVPRSHPR